MTTLYEYKYASYKQKINRALLPYYNELSTLAFTAESLMS